MAKYDIIRVCDAPVGRYDRAGFATLLANEALARRKGGTRPFVSYSVNGQVLAEMFWNRRFKASMLRADICDADGMPVVMASRVLARRALPERIATTDFFHDLAREAEAKGLSFYLLGAKPQRLATAVAEIRRLYPKLKIAGAQDGYFDRRRSADIIKQIKATRPDVLWVGFGVPLQHYWIEEHLDSLRGIGVIKTCGGLFDYFSPDIRRSPLWMQKAGLEWLFRTIQEPRRFLWRYLTTNPVALWVLLTTMKDGGDA